MRTARCPAPRGHADADLSPALRHRIAEQAVETEGGEQRHGGEGPGAKGVEAGLRGLSLEERLERRGVDERARTGVGDDLAEEGERPRADHPQLREKGEKVLAT